MMGQTRLVQELQHVTVTRFVKHSNTSLKPVSLTNSPQYFRISTGSGPRFGPLMEQDQGDTGESVDHDNCRLYIGARTCD